MIISDRIYGTIEINEPLILELLASPAMLRLKNIDQGGYTKPFFTEIIYRFEHSIGVYWLLKKYGASLEEQVAGLIHDVSHSAFSHCIDYVLEGDDGGKQNHQDNIFNDFVKKSNIPEILKKYGLDINYILDDKNFPLKERDLPELCADRIDYFLRTASILNKMTSEEINHFLDNLIIINQQWVFKNLQSAQDYAELFLWINKNYWISVTSAAMHLAVGEYLAYALQKKYITISDLYTTDEEVLNKIQPYLKKDAKLDFFWERMNNKKPFKEDQNNYDKPVCLKSRAVDPLFLDGATIERISNVKKDWGNIIIESLKPVTRFIKFND